MVDPDQIKAFGDKSLGGILEEAYERSNEEREVIEGLIDELSGLMDDTDDAVMLVPLIKDYLDINVKNNEQLIKISKIIQRMYNATIKEDEGGSAATGGLSDQEKSQIRNLAEEMGDAKIDELKDKAEKAAEEVKDQ